MNTLTSPPVAPLLEQLFADARETGQKLREMFGAMTQEERLKRMGDPSSDYRQFFAKVKHIHMPVSAETGKLLYMLARSNGARAIVEFGTSFGISTLHFAAALRDNGGGTLIGSEFEPGKLEHARQNLAAAGLSDLVEIREGDALETLARDLPETIDGVLLDGHKPLYGRILALLSSRFRPGSFVVADNADACPDYLAQVRAPDSGYLSIAFAKDVELTIKV
jgi:predicted O-methyltransferase YrrM